MLYPLIFNLNLINGNVNNMVMRFGNSDKETTLFSFILRSIYERILQIQPGLNTENIL